MGKLFWSFIDFCVWGVPGMIAAIAIYIAIIIGRWQLSGQQTPQAVFDYVTVLFWIAIALCFALGVAAYIKAYRRESNRERKENAIRAIGDLLREGSLLIQRINAVPKGNLERFNNADNEMKAWENRSRNFFTKYDARFVSFVDDRSGCILKPPGEWEELDENLNRVSARIQRLDRMLSLISMR